jgi:aryl-alcohol dehydrogenase-like predicted oxidoreductase
MRTTATLGLGMATFVPNYGLKPGEVASSAVVLGAIRDGFRYIDTAASYGGAEAALGETASALAAVGARVATKVAATRAGDVLSSAEIVDSVEASLLRLKVTGVDTLLWHSASPDALRSEDVATAARHVRTRGWALRSGASTYGADDAVTALSQPWCQVLQFEFSLLNQSVWQRIEGLRARPRSWSHVVCCAKAC